MSQFNAQILDNIDLIMRRILHLRRGENYKRQVPLQELITYKTADMDNDDRFKIFVSFNSLLKEYIQTYYPFMDIEVDLNWTTYELVETIVNTLQEMPKVKISKKNISYKTIHKDAINIKAKQIFCEVVGIKFKKTLPVRNYFTDFLKFDGGNKTEIVEKFKNDFSTKLIEICPSYPIGELSEYGSLDTVIWRLEQYMTDDDVQKIVEGETKDAI